MVISCKTRSHFSRALFFLPLWVAWKTTFLPQYATCDPHNTVKRNNLCAYCFYTHHMSRHTQCHQRVVGTTTSSMGAVLLHNVWDASFLSYCTNVQPPQSLKMKNWSVMLVRWHTESHWNTHYELCLYVIKSCKLYIKSCPVYVYHLSAH